MTIATALTRLQVLALACTGIRGAPDYPVSDAGVLPLSIAHVVSGDGTAQDAITDQMRIVANVDFHFNRTSLKDAYTRISALVPEFLDRLAGDPKLGGAVDTIIFPVTFDVQPTQWDSVATQMCSFAVTMKLRDNVVST